MVEIQSQESATQWLDWHYTLISEQRKLRERSRFYEPQGHIWIGDVELIRQWVQAWRSTHEPKLPVAILNCAEARETGKTPTRELKAITHQLLAEFGKDTPRIPTELFHRLVPLREGAKEKDTHLLLLLNPERLHPSVFEPLSFNYFKYSSCPQWDWILATDTLKAVESLKIASTSRRLFWG